MKKILRPFIISFILYTVSFNTILSQQINVDEINDIIKTLSSEEFGGRRPGEPGCNLAANYIRDQFIKAGLIPIKGEFFQQFEVVKDVQATQNNKLNFEGFSGVLNTDFTPFSFSENAKFEAEVVFAGYGFDINENNIKWTDYNGLDVKGKWVLVFLGDPELDSSQSRFVKYSDQRSKILTAKDKGASGVLFVQGVSLSKKDDLISIQFDKSQSRTGIPVINVTRNVANKILFGKGKKIEDLEKELNSKLTANSFETGVKLSAETEVLHSKVKTENVIGIIPANSDEYIIIGAHYDHLGMGGIGSGSRKEDTSAVHHGADDNASGVAGIIQLAKVIAANKNNLKRNVIFVAFSAEEMGILGSKYFVKNPPINLKKVNAMFNIDMIGRLKDDMTLIVGGTGTSKESEAVLDKLINGREIKISKSPEGFGPSDHAAFYAENIPVFFFTTGAHEDYHRPEDDIAKINAGREKICLDFIHILIMTIDKMPVTLTFQEAGPKFRQGSGRYKVKLGFMPDFATNDKPGVGVDGVTKDSPADHAGFKKGDRIIAIEGKPVKDIYEYMARLNKLSPGQQITVDILREDKKIILLVQL